MESRLSDCSVAMRNVLLALVLLAGKSFWELRSSEFTGGALAVDFSVSLHHEYLSYSDSHHFAASLIHESVRNCGFSHQLFSLS